MKHEIKNGYIELSKDCCDNGAYEIDMVQVNEKRKGTGTKLMQWAIKWATKKDVNLTLCACPQDDSIELEDLVKFYESFGFEETYRQSDCVLMKMYIA